MMGELGRKGGCDYMDRFLIIDKKNGFLFKLHKKDFVLLAWRKL